WGLWPSMGGGRPPCRCYNGGPVVLINRGRRIVTLAVALAGAGNIAQIHLDAIRRAGGVEVIGIFDQNATGAQDRATAYGIPNVYSSWDDLRADPRVQCVAVLLPHDLHERFAVEALASGKHVVCEKPLGQSVDECDRILDAAQRAQRLVFPV